MISNTVHMRDVDAAVQKLRTVIRLFTRRAYAMTGKRGPTRSEQGVLSLLDERGAATPGALAALECVRPQTMGQTLDSLARRRCIRRTRHPKDRRQVLVSLTPTGQKALTVGRDLRQAWLMGEFGKLSKKELKTLIGAIDLLERMVQS